MAWRETVDTRPDAYIRLGYCSCELVAYSGDQLWSSDDGGDHWNEPETLSLPEGHDELPCFLHAGCPIVDFFFEVGNPGYARLNRDTGAWTFTPTPEFTAGAARVEYNRHEAGVFLYHGLVDAGGGTQAEGILVSRDAGATYDVVIPPDQDILGGTYITSISYDGNGRITCLYSTPSTAFIRISEDYGATWLSPAAGPWDGEPVILIEALRGLDSVYLLVAETADNELLTYRSTDRGYTWGAGTSVAVFDDYYADWVNANPQNIAKGNGEFFLVLVSGDGPNTVFISRDEGLNWTEEAVGIDNPFEGFYIGGRWFVSGFTDLGVSQAAVEDQAFDSDCADGEAPPETPPTASVAGPTDCFPAPTFDSSKWYLTRQDGPVTIETEGNLLRVTLPHSTAIMPGGEPSNYVYLSSVEEYDIRGKTIVWNKPKEFVAVSGGSPGNFTRMFLELRQMPTEDPFENLIWVQLFLTKNDDFGSSGPQILFELEEQVIVILGMDWWDLHWKFVNENSTHWSLWYSAESCDPDHESWVKVAEGDTENPIAVDDRFRLNMTFALGSTLEDTLLEAVFEIEGVNCCDGPPAPPVDPPVPCVNCPPRVRTPVTSSLWT